MQITFEQPRLVPHGWVKQDDTNILVFKPEPLERYAPPEDLFLEFAEVKPAPDDIERFAQLYGPLGIETKEVRIVERSVAGRRRKDDPLASVPKFQSTTLLRGEPLDAWRREIADMRYAVQRLLVSKGGLLEANDLIGFAQLDLRQIINAKLRQTIHPQIALSHERRRPNALRYGDTEIYLEPANLLGSMWLNLAQAFAEKRQFRKCAYCRRSISFVARGGRLDKLTCSDSCRVRLSNLRSAYRAQRLSLAEAAKRLGVDKRTARDILDRSTKPAGRRE